MYIGTENEQIVFKKSTGELNEALNSISAILNKHGNGTIYFGVKNNGEAIGQQISDQSLRDISRDIRQFIKPECYFTISESKLENGLSIIQVEFSGDRIPYSSKGKYFLRFSDEDKQMSDIELETLFRNRIKDYSFWENSQSDATTADVDNDLIIREIQKGEQEGRNKENTEDVTHVLSKLGLLCQDKIHLNNAGNVLFSKKKPILLKLAVYATTNKDTFLKLNHFEGNIYECIEAGMNHILSSIDWNISLDGNLQRTESPEIPAKALREIIMNAFCHAKYDSNTAFEIDVFSDRVTIYSPGYFPLGFTPEDFAKSHESPIMLNPKIVKTLYRTNEIESFGYGFENTFRECLKADVKYSYENTKSGFKFTFVRPIAEKRMLNKLSATDVLVFEIIKENNDISAPEIAARINKSSKTVYRSIKKLKDMKYITRIGSDLKGSWQILV